MKGKRIAAIALLTIVMIFSLGACTIVNNLINQDTTTTTTGGTDYATLLDVKDVGGLQKADFYNKDTGKTVVPSTTPTKEGYTFEGFYKDSTFKEAFKGGEDLTKHITVYGKWSVTTFDVKLVDEKNGEKVIEVEYGEKLSIADPTAAGFVFQGWYTDAARTTAFDKKTGITSELILYAKWGYVQYNITYVLNGGRFQSGTTVPETYDENTKVTLPSPVKDKFDFIGWYEEEDLTGERVTELDGEKGNKTFYAKYLSLFAEMSAKEGFSEETDTDEFALFTDYSAHEVDFTGYFTFSQNSTLAITDVTDGENPQAVTGTSVALAENAGTSGMKVFSYEVLVTSESGLRTHVYTVTIYQYDESMVTVTYVVDGETKKVDTIAQASILEEAGYVAPVKTGYTFEYWTEDGASEYVFGSALSENVVLTAKYVATVYTISYSLGKANNLPGNPDSYTVESEITLVDAVAPEGYTFVGWYDDGTYTNQVTVVEDQTGDLTLYAYYTKTPKWSFAYADGEYTVTMAQYPYFLDYLLYSRVSEQTTVNVTDKPDDFMTKYADKEYTVLYDENVHAKYYTKGTTPAGEVNVGYGISISVGDKVKVTFSFSGTFNPTDTSDQGTYEQVNFVEYQAKQGRAEGFTDFAINHVRETLPVSDTEQLFFALENGYRPVCAAGSMAETVYDAMLAILKEIVNDEMTDVEKVTAIGEYLVKEIQYDNYVYTLFLNGYDTNNYRCFRLEGAILDKVAVCDGISKAFACLCRIEGIEAVQVDGTHNGTNHAWNKVKVDLDGNGTTEWSVVDCTSANLLLTLTGGGKVEIMNHAFFFTTDDMLTNKENYVYDEKWDGLYTTNTYYNLYQHVTLGEGEDQVTLYATTREELKAVFKYYVDVIYSATAAEDRPISLSVCTLRSLIDGSIGNLLHEAGFTVEQINGQKVKTVSLNAQYDQEVVYLFYLDEE